MLLNKRSLNGRALLRTDLLNTHYVVFMMRSTPIFLEQLKLYSRLY